MKKTINLSESDLNRIVKETVQNVLNERKDFRDSIKGAAVGLSRGYKDINTPNETLHALSSAISAACSKFGDIMRMLSKNDVEGAKRECMAGYRDLKGAFNKTEFDGNRVTSQYGAQDPRLAPGTVVTRDNNGNVKLPDYLDPWPNN